MFCVILFHEHIYIYTARVLKQNKKLNFNYLSLCFFFFGPLQKGRHVGNEKYDLALSDVIFCLVSMYFLFSLSLMNAKDVHRSKVNFLFASLTQWFFKARSDIYFSRWVLEHPKVSFLILLPNNKKEVSIKHETSN